LPSCCFTWECCFPTGVPARPRHTHAPALSFNFETVSLPAYFSCATILTTSHHHLSRHRTNIEPRKISFVGPSPLPYTGLLFCPPIINMKFSLARLLLAFVASVLCVGSLQRHSSLRGARLRRYCGRQRVPPRSVARRRCQGHHHHSSWRWPHRDRLSFLPSLLPHRHVHSLPNGTSVLFIRSCCH
jgi:hypothetical protein